MMGMIHGTRFPGVVYPAKQEPKCVISPDATSNTFVVTGLHIEQGDTVIVATAFSNSGTGLSTGGPQDDGGSIYDYLTGHTGTSPRLQLWGSMLGMTHPATQLTFTTTANTRFLICIAAFRKVSGYGNTGTGTGSTFNLSPGIYYAGVNVNASSPNSQMIYMIAGASTRHITYAGSTFLEVQATTTTTPLMFGLMWDTISWYAGVGGAGSNFITDQATSFIYTGVELVPQGAP
jgi:hypothetical protein